MKKSALVLLLLACLLLSGCSAFSREYVSIRDYVPTAQEPGNTDGKITVRNFNALKQALLQMAYYGQTEGSIVFDAAYEGDTTEDMASACWSVRTQDALCAYCVENIAYELNKIVTFNEAGVHISYSKVTESPENIQHLAVSSEAENLILDAMNRGERKLALLVGRSGFTADDMAAQVLKVYRDNPTVVPKEPTASVNIYSGTGAQRLYEINIRYGLTQEELENRLEELRAVRPFAEEEIAALSEPERALAACLYLTEHCVVSEDPAANSAYNALVEGEADSEGIAFAYVALCRELGLDCRIVYGQHDWQEHCWNIVYLDGGYYHVDVTRCARGEMAGGFLENDEGFWGLYRWDVSAYPKCQGELRYTDVMPEPELTVEAPEEEPEAPENVEESEN